MKGRTKVKVKYKDKKESKIKKIEFIISIILTIVTIYISYLGYNLSEFSNELQQKNQRIDFLISVPEENRIEVEATEGRATNISINVSYYFLFDNTKKYILLEGTTWYIDKQYLDSKIKLEDIEFDMHRIAESIDIEGEKAKPKKVIKINYTDANSDLKNKYFVLNTGVVSFTLDDNIAFQTIFISDNIDDITQKYNKVYESKQSHIYTNSVHAIKEEEDRFIKEVMEQYN